MSNKVWLSMAVALAIVLPGPSARASSDGDRYNIMTPERPQPWLAPKYKSPQGTRERVTTPPSAPAPKRRATVPPSLYVPETGRVLPNFPTVSGSGPKGAETYQDRAARCAHQSGAYGPAATGNRSAYIGTCINQ